MGTRVKEMIKVKDIVEKYGEFEINEEELKKILVEPKTKTVWDLRPGDKYFALCTDSDIVENTWEDDDIDRSIRYSGNAFLTYEEAEFERGRRSVETELIKLGGTRDMMSLGDNNCFKYLIYYNNFTKTVEIEGHESYHYSGAIYFKTKKECYEAIGMIGEDVIKKFLFHVK